MSRIVVAVTGLVVSVSKDGQMTVRVCGGQLGFRAGIVEGLFASVELEIAGFFCGSAEALASRVALATIVVNLDVALDLVFFVAAVALGVMRLGLARTTAVFTLLDRTALGIDMMQFSITVGAAAHAVTLDAGLARIFLAVDNRHSGVVTADCGRRKRAIAAGRKEYPERRGGSRRQKVKETALHAGRKASKRYKIQKEAKNAIWVEAVLEWVSTANAWDECQERGVESG